MLLCYIQSTANNPTIQQLRRSIQERNQYSRLYRSAGQAIYDTSTLSGSPNRRCVCEGCHPDFVTSVDEQSNYNSKFVVIRSLKLELIVKCLRTETTLQSNLVISIVTVSTGLSYGPRGVKMKPFMS